MAKNKVSLKELALDELTGQVATLGVEMEQMLFTHSTTGLQNPLEIRNLRRQVARVHTELRAREVSQMSPSELAKRSKKRARRAKS